MNRHDRRRARKMAPRKTILEVSIHGPDDVARTFHAALRGDHEAQVLAKIITGWAARMIRTPPGEKPLCVAATARASTTRSGRSRSRRRSQRGRERRSSPPSARPAPRATTSTTSSSTTCWIIAAGTSSKWDERDRRSRHRRGRRRTRRGFVGRHARRNSTAQRTDVH